MPVAAARQLASPGSTATVLERLHELGLTERDIARATGANERSVRRWFTGAAMKPKSEEQIDDLRTVVAELADAMPPDVIVNWLRGRNRVLGLRRPIDVLGEGKFTEVIDAIEAFKGGDHV